MSVKTDRRTQSRKRPLSLVYVELPPSNGGMLRDLNEQGFALRAMMPLHLSEKLPFSISLDNGVRIDGEAIVVRLEDKGHVAALEFAGLAAHSRDQIRRWLEKFEEPLSRQAWAPKPPTAHASTLEELRYEARKVMAEPPAHYTEPVAAPPEPEPEPEQPPLVPQRKQLEEHEPPPPPSAPQAVPLVVPPLQEIAPVQPPPPPVAAPTEVAPVSSQEQLELPPQLVTQPPAPALDAPAEQLFESAELPLPKFLQQPENAPQPPLPPQLPPLLKLSSVRPTPPAEPPKEPVIPVPHARIAEAPLAPNPIPLSEILIQPPSVIAASPSPPAPARAPVLSRVVPPPLEPLSIWESETDAASPGRTESFTLGRAIGIMVFLTLLVGSVVYHREVGHALIWLGRQIAGEEPQETSQVTQPPAPAIVSTPVASTAPANSPSLPQQEAAAERKTAATPSAPENLAAPRADANPTPQAAPADSSSGTGQDEYQRAMQILKAPSRKAELREAVRLLWIAVKKNNVGAEITLAELYHQGRGVAKSCDQTKILLSAAARRGSPDARRRLQEFQREGCRN